MRQTPETRIRRLIRKNDERSSERLWRKLLDPLVFLTLALAVLAYFQYRVLDRTDGTMNRQLAASKAAQRARIGSSGVTVVAGPGGGWQLTPTLRNVGTTEAVSVRIEYLAKNAVTADDPIKPNISYMPHDPITLLRLDRIGKEALAPNVDRNLPTVFISQEQYKAAAGRPFYLSGIATYYDVFDPTVMRITKFCYEIKGGGGFAMGPFEASAFSVNLQPNYVPCPYWNCADDTCIADLQDYERDLDAAFDKASRVSNSSQPEKPDDGP